jgi:hypothetical protein
MDTRKDYEINASDQHNTESAKKNARISGTCSLGRKQLWGCRLQYFTRIHQLKQVAYTQVGNLLLRAYGAEY